MEQNWNGMNGKQGDYVTSVSLWDLMDCYSEGLITGDSIKGKSMLPTLAQHVVLRRSHYLPFVVDALSTDLCHLSNVGRGSLSDRLGT